MKAAILGRLFVLGSAAKRDVAILQRYARKALGMGRRPVGSRLNVINPFAFHSRLCGDESLSFPIVATQPMAGLVATRYWGLSRPRLRAWSRYDVSMKGRTSKPLSLSFCFDRIAMPSANCAAVGTGKFGTTSPMKKS
jgi:hypothetical protein